MTFSASANPIVYQGAIPVFIDSETETWNMCPIALEDAIKDRISKGKKPKAIIGVHLYGMPFKVDEIKKQLSAAENAAPVINSVKVNGNNVGVDCTVNESSNTILILLINSVHFYIHH